MSNALASLVGAKSDGTEDKLFLKEGKTLVSNQFDADIILPDIEDDFLLEVDIAPSLMGTQMTLKKLAGNINLPGENSVIRTQLKKGDVTEFKAGGEALEIHAEQITAPIKSLIAPLGLALLCIVLGGAAWIISGLTQEEQQPIIAATQPAQPTQTFNEARPLLLQGDVADELFRQLASIDLAQNINFTPDGEGLLLTGEISSRLVSRAEEVVNGVRARTLIPIEMRLTPTDSIFESMVAAVSLSEPRFVILKSGERLQIGSRFNNGWVVDKIESNSVLIKRGALVEEYRF